MNFTYKHITQNQELESFVSEGLNDVIMDLMDRRSVKVLFYRIFDNKDRLKEVVEIHATVDGKSYNIIGVHSSFKNAVKSLLTKLKFELKNKQTSPHILQSA